jgi:hypothetical protein
MPTGLGTSLLLSSIIGAGASVAGGALANKSSSDSKSTTTPTLDPAYGPLQTQVLSMIGKRLNSSNDLSGYQASGMSRINRTFDTLKQSQDNNLAARGLSASPVAGNVDAVRTAARGANLADFGNSIPLLQRDLQTQDLGLAGNVLGLGRGTTTTGTSSGQSGGGAGGAATSLAAYLGYLNGKGAFGNKGPLGGGPYQTPPFVPNDTNGWG